MSGEKIIVLVSDKGDGKHGEISVLDDPQKAERLVEALLEAGFEEDRIHVFSGKASGFQVSHRPVVALVTEGEERESPPAMEIAGREPVGEEPAIETPVAPVKAKVTAEAKPAVPQTLASKTGDEPPEEMDEEQEEADAPEAKTVKFSSLFRSA